MGRRVKLPGNGKAEKRKVVQADLPRSLYDKLAGDAAISKRSISKQLEYVIEEAYKKGKNADAIRG